MGHVDQLHKTSKQDCYASALTIIGHLPRFLILNELNKNSVIASKNWTLNATAAARKKIRRRLDWSVDDFDSMEIRLGKSAKFVGAGVYGVVKSS